MAKRKRIGYNAHERVLIKLGRAIACLMDAQRILSGVHMNGDESASMRLGEAHGLLLQVRRGITPTNQVLVSALRAQLTPGQRKLMKKHGTPAQFAESVYSAVPGDISMVEARAAVDKYQKEWEAA